MRQADADQELDYPLNLVNNYPINGIVSLFSNILPVSYKP